MTSDPWITTPEFRTWSRISRRETSSSPPPSTATDSKSFGIRDKRVRRPWPINFDAPLPVPPLHKIFERLVPLPAFGARHQKRGLPQQVGLRAAYLAAGRGFGGNLAQRGRQFLRFLVITFWTFLQTRRFLLQIFFARACFCYRYSGNLTLRKHLYTPLVPARDAGKNLLERSFSSLHVLHKRRFTGKYRSEAGRNNRHLLSHFAHHLLMAHAI